MIPVDCMVKHDPPNSYGDCVRACVASLLELGSPDVRHFFKDGCDGETGKQRMTAWLLERGWAPCWQYLSPTYTLDQVLSFMGEANTHVHYMLFGVTADGGHVVVAKGGAIVHNPAWDKAPLIGPSVIALNGETAETWAICVLTRA